MCPGDGQSAPCQECALSRFGLAPYPSEKSLFDSVSKAQTDSVLFLCGFKGTALVQPAGHSPSRHIVAFGWVWDEPFAVPRHCPEACPSNEPKSKQPHPGGVCQVQCASLCKSLGVWVGMYVLVRFGTHLSILALDASVSGRGRLTQCKCQRLLSYAR